MSQRNKVILTNVSKRLILVTEGQKRGEIMEDEKKEKMAEVAKIFDEKETSEKEFMLGVIMGMSLQKKIDEIKSA